MRHLQPLDTIQEIRRKGTKKRIFLAIKIPRKRDIHISRTMTPQFPTARSRTVGLTHARRAEEDVVRAQCEPLARAPAPSYLQGLSPLDSLALGSPNAGHQIAGAGAAAAVAEAPRTSIVGVGRARRGSRGG
jgi:hypothetical protein